MKNIGYALRYLVKTLGSNIIRIISITLGLSIGLLVFSFVAFEASFDRFIPDKERVYQIWNNYNIDGMQGNSSQLYGTIAPAVMEEFPQVEAATRYIVVGNSIVYGESTFSCKGLYADSMFFDVLDYGVIIGDPRKILADRSQVMLSESTSKAIFGDRDPIGEVITMKATKEYPLTVAGIFRDIPRNTQIDKFEMICSFELASDFFYTGWNGGDSFDTFIKLRKGSRIEEVEADMDRFIDKYGMRDMMAEWNMKYFFTPLEKSYKTSMEETDLAPIVIAIGLLTLFIAAMNYILVSISLLFKRGKTMAMLKCNGATRKDIFGIFMYETLFILLISLLLSVPIIFSFDGMLVNLAEISVKDLFTWDRIWAPGLVIIGMFAFTGIVTSNIFAAVPVNIAFRGSFTGRSWWKKILLFIQLTVVTLAVTLLFISLRQFNLLSNGDYGYNKDNLLFTSFVGTPAQQQTIKDELSAMPEVVSVGAGDSMPIWGYSGQPAFDENTKELLFSCRYGLIDYNYIPTREMSVVEGRNFTSDDGGDKVIVNEEYVRLRGWPEGTAVGRNIIDEDGPNPVLYTVIGVIRDFWMQYGGQILPIVYHNTKEYFYKEEARYRSGYVMMRVNKVTPETISGIERKLEAFFPGSETKVQSFDYYFQHNISSPKIIRNLTLMASIAMLLIALTGLVGYVNDEINRKSKQIAIRKVNGARRKDILSLIARDAAIITLPAVIAGGVCAYLLGKGMLATFAQKTPLHWWIFVLGALIVAGIVFAVEFIRTWKIAGSNPIDMIKTE